MKKMNEWISGDHVLVRCTSYLGFCSFLMLNLLALIEYIKFKAGISNVFIECLPSVKILLNIDFLFCLGLFLIYNKLEGFFKLRTLLIVLILIFLAWGLYKLTNQKPLTIIMALGLYAVGIAIFTWVIGLGAIFKSPQQKGQRII